MAYIFPRNTQLTYFLKRKIELSNDAVYINFPEEQHARGFIRQNIDARISQGQKTNVNIRFDCKKIRSLGVNEDDEFFIDVGTPADATALKLKLQGIIGYSCSALINKSQIVGKLTNGYIEVQYQTNQTVLLSKDPGRHMN